MGESAISSPSPTVPSRIALDGPAASGKTTIGRQLALKLGYLYLDTGVMYRAVALAALRAGVPPSDEEAVSKLAEAARIDVEPPAVDDGRACTVLLGGEDVTWAVRAPEVDASVSVVSAFPRVRNAMVAQQRVIGRRGRVLMVGRDIGTVVMPDAELKVYLDASVEERARRRFEEQRNRGGAQSQTEVQEALRRRDAQDSSRAVGPLRPADDAWILDTSALSPEAVLELLEKKVRGR